MRHQLSSDSTLVNQSRHDVLPFRIFFLSLIVFSSPTTPTLPVKARYGCAKANMPDAPSDDEWDISKSLLPARDVHSDDLSGDDHNRDHDHAPNETKASHDDIGAYLDVNGDDEAFIATQQSASNRKASNLKGRSVKKGGGFQAMGGFLRVFFMRCIP